MTSEVFNVILDRRLALTRSILASKVKEYATDDRLYNFKRAAQLRKCSFEDALMGMLVKHWVSVEDLITAKKNGIRSDDFRIDEKIGDAINYLILLEALLKE